MQIHQISIALRSAFERHRRYQRVCRELNGLSDRELAEIGIYRSDITEVAREDAERLARPAGEPRLRLATAA